MIKIAIVGAGEIGKRYAQHLLKMGQTEIAGIYDESCEAAMELANQYGCPFFSSFEALIEALPLGTVFVCTGASDSRKRNILQALETGNHVIAEMPVACRLGEVQDMLTAARTSGSRLLFTNPGRFYYHNIDLKKRIGGGVIGSLGMINAKRYCPVIPEGTDRMRCTGNSCTFEPGLSWVDGIRWTGGHYGNTTEEAPGGALYRLALQEIDILRWIAGEAASVYAMRTATERLDYVLVTIKFQSGAIANLEAYWGYPGENTSAVEYAGSRGVIRYDSRKTDALHMYKNSDAAVIPGKRGFSPSFRNPEYDDLVQLLDCIKEGGQPAMTAEDALETMKVVSAASQSIRTGQPVELISYSSVDDLNMNENVNRRKGGGEDA